MIKNPPIIKKVVREMGGKIEEILPEKGFFRIILAGEKIFVSRKFQISRSLIASKTLTSNKDLTYFIFKENKIPTPTSIYFHKKTLSEKELEKKLTLLKYPVVIKNSRGSNSLGVFMEIKTPAEAKRVVLEQIKKFNSLIVQEMIFGKEYRVLILENKAIGVLEMIPPHVIGDGEKTVALLIKEKQAKKYKKTNFDQTLNRILRKQKMRLSSIPAKNQVIYIKQNSCLAEGGETSDQTALIHPEIEKICVKAAKVTDKSLAGIDLICDDITKDPKKQTFSILEINGMPDIYIHYKPTWGETQDVVKKILLHILKLKKAERKIFC